MTSKIITYGITLLIAISIIIQFALWHDGSFISGIGIGFTGAFGNTIPALIAALVSVVAIARAFLTQREDRTSWFAGKVLALIVGIGTVLALFSNGILIYLKLQDAGVSENLYVQMLGNFYWEAAMCFLLLAGWFYKSK